MFLYTKVYFVIFYLISIVALSARHARRLTVNGTKNWIYIANDRGGVEIAILDEPNKPIPKANVKEDVKFLLHTRSNPRATSINVGDINSLLTSSFNSSHPTKFLIHGFAGGLDNSIIVDGKTVYLSNGDYNVIVIDWTKFCLPPFYPIAILYMQQVGPHIARMVDFLVSPEIGANLKDIHILAHSLGAHLAGVVGENVKSGKVGRITGLDSAGPLFYNEDTEGRLDASDAELVDVIHTHTLFLGMREPHGHIDFYPFGGTKQLGCGYDEFGVCSHGKAVEYFFRSIGKEGMFQATRCQSVSEAEEGSCTGEVAFMGENISFETGGIYYLTVEVCEC